MQNHCIYNIQVWLLVAVMVWVCGGWKQLPPRAVPSRQERVYSYDVMMQASE
jgi:hypothetical protein